MAKLTERYIRNHEMFIKERGPIYISSHGSRKEYYNEFKVNNLEFRSYHEKGGIEIDVDINDTFWEVRTTEEFDTLITITSSRH